MAAYDPLNDPRIANLALSWIQSGVTTIHIAMGPLSVRWETDIYNSSIRIITIETGQVTIGSLRWFESRYIAFRSIYGFLRMFGLMSWEWEIPNDFEEFDMALYHDIIWPHRPYLRVKYPQQLIHPLCVEHLGTYSYMKIYPTFPTNMATQVYPMGDTTTWVDKFLSKDPQFSLNILPAMDEEGEGFLF